MKRKTFLAIFIGIIVFPANPLVVLPAPTRVVGYVYTDAEEDIQKLDIDFCTDLVVAFAYFDPDATSPEDYASDKCFDPNPNNNDKCCIKWHGMSTPSIRKKLREMAKDKRVLLGVGGAGQDYTKGFEKLMENCPGDEQCLINAIDTLKKLVSDEGYNGIDIDWEFPENKKDLFKKFMEEVVKQFKQNNYIVSIAVNGDNLKKNSYGLDDDGSYKSKLDYVNFMGYDYNWNDANTPNSPIDKIKEDCEKIVKAGINIAKINVLLPYYTRYSSYNPPLNGPPPEPEAPVPFFTWGTIRDTVCRIPSEFDETALERKIQEDSWPIFPEDDPRCPKYAMSDWFYVVDPYSMYRKVKYLTREKKISIGLLKKGNVGGIGIWQIAQQDVDPTSHAEMGTGIKAGIQNQKSYLWPPLEGTWSGHWESSMNKDWGPLKISFTQDKDKIFGTIIIINPDPDIGTITSSFSGKVSQDSWGVTCKFTYRGKSQTATLKANSAYGQSTISGTYTIKGSLINDSGSFSVKLSEVPGYSIFGRVYYSTTPFPDVKVELIEGDLRNSPTASTHTDSSGFFTFAGLTSGNYSVKAYGTNSDYVGWVAWGLALQDSDKQVNFYLEKKMTLLSPANKIIIGTSKPQFCWQGPPEAVKYSFQLNKSADWTRIVFIYNYTSTCYQLTQNLENNVRYTWQADGFDRFGNPVASTESPFQFTVNTESASNFIPLAKDNSVIQGDVVFATMERE